MKKHFNSSKKGFTLLEILLVVAAIAILAGIVILAINPTKQLGDTRNAQRRADINTILNAVYQYAVDNDGAIPAAVNSTGGCATAANEICMSGGDCLDPAITDLSVLTSNARYLVSIPYDPSISDVDGTGYYIFKDANNRVSVCATGESGAGTFTVTR